MAAELEEAGHEVIVANPRRVHLIFAGNDKSDKRDAELLARLGRTDPGLLHPIQHRSAPVQADLALVRAREALVKQRTATVNFIRGIFKPFGLRVPKCSPAALPNRMSSLIPDELLPSVGPMVAVVEHLTEQIKSFEKAIEAVAERCYPQTKRLRQVPGVGAISALTFVLTIESPERFPRRRSVGAFLGLVPKKSQSGDKDPRMSITKTGDTSLRQLLVNCSHYIIGPFGPDSSLKRFGIALKEKHGHSRRAAVAVARKLSVLLLTLWATGEDYLPEGKRLAA